MATPAMLSPNTSPFAKPAVPVVSGISGRQAHIFQPPKTPYSGTTSPYRTPSATGADYFSQNTSRKRSRPDSSHDLGIGGGWQQTPWTNTPAPTDGIYGSAGLSVNERYALKDGLDTPGLNAAAFEAPTPYEDGGRRRWRDGVGSHMEFSSEASLSHSPLARERNGHARIPSPLKTPGQSTLDIVIGLAGSVVGKAFTFSTAAFKGFFAGGGKGYRIEQPAKSPHSQDGRLQREGTPLPGSWIGERSQDYDDFLGDFEQDNATPERPPAKRRLTDKDVWVMVNTPEAREGSPRRKSAAPQSPAPRASASRASSRRSLVPVSSQQSGHIPQYCSPSAPQPLSPARRASLAPVRSRPNSSSGAAYSPEVSQFAAKKAREERKAEKAMSSMSKKLEELIRQGQAALGTKVSIEDEVSSEGGEMHVGEDEWGAETGYPARSWR